MLGLCWVSLEQGYSVSPHRHSPVEYCQSKRGIPGISPSLSFLRCLKVSRILFQLKLKFPSLSSGTIEPAQLKDYMTSMDEIDIRNRVEDLSFVLNLLSWHLQHRTEPICRIIVSSIFSQIKRLPPRLLTAMNQPTSQDMEIFIFSLLVESNTTPTDKQERFWSSMLHYQAKYTKDIRRVMYVKAKEPTAISNYFSTPNLGKCINDIRRGPDDVTLLEQLLLLLYSIRHVTPLQRKENISYLYYRYTHAVAAAGKPIHHTLATSEFKDLISPDPLYPHSSTLHLLAPVGDSSLAIVQQSSLKATEMPPCQSS